MPRHDESHVAIPALASAVLLLAGLLLVGGCAGQMAGPPWDTAPWDTAPSVLDSGAAAEGDTEWNWDAYWDSYWGWGPDWGCGPPPSGAAACAPGAFGGPADPVFGPVLDALHGYEIHRLWDPIPGGM